MRSNKLLLYWVIKACIDISFLELFNETQNWLVLLKILLKNVLNIFNLSISTKKLSRWQADFFSVVCETLSRPLPARPITFLRLEIRQ